MNFGSESEEVKLSNKQCAELLKQGGLMVRNIYDFDCPEKTHFWYVIKDRFGGMEELSSKMRNQVRRSFANYDFRMIGKDYLLENGYPIHHDATSSYRTKAQPPSRQEFEDDLNQGVENEFWGAFEKCSGKLVAFAKNQVLDSSCNYSVLKALPEHLKQYVYYGLIYEMNRYYLEERRLKFVNDGARSITQHSNIQDFLIDKFHFRKAYCHLAITYRPWLKIIVCLLYPFRSIIPIRKARILLFQEQMSR